MIVISIHCFGKGGGSRGPRHKLLPLFLRLCSLLRDVILKIKDRIDKTALLFDESELDVVLAPPFS